MSSLLIAVIYLAFISLGLPDSLLGAGWPDMHQQMQAPISAAGIITMLISCGTVISSLFSGIVARRLGTGVTVAVSTALTACGIFGFAFSTEFWMLCVLAFPYGLGAGAIDVALNNYVALHYSSRQMSWLHCFWGVGTIISPYIMSYALTDGLGWSSGYKIVGVIQTCIVVALLFALPLWKKVAENRKTADEGEERGERLGLLAVCKLRGVPFVLFGFFAYCAAEATVILWASSYLFQTQGIGEELAAALGSIFFIGITGGRFLSGFISDKVGDKNMIRAGITLSGLGIIVIALPIGGLTVATLGFLVIGLGFAPIYPSVIHATPNNFGAENSQSIIGIQMAAAYVGSTFMPPVFGLIAQYIRIELLPLYLACFVVLMFVMTELLNKSKKKI